MIDESKLNELIGRVLGDLGGAMSIAVVRMGDSLGLYKALHAKGPLTPEALAARLPRDLRRFDNWQYSEDGRATGLAAYLHALTAWIADQHGTPVDVNVAPLVMREAGLDVADWYWAATSTT